MKKLTKNSWERRFLTLFAASVVETSFGWFLFILWNRYLSPSAINCFHEASLCFHLTLFKFSITLHKPASEGGPSFILLYSVKLWILVLPFNTNYAHKWILLHKKNQIMKTVIIIKRVWRIIGGKSNRYAFFSNNIINLLLQLLILRRSLLKKHAFRLNLMIVCIWNYEWSSLNDVVLYNLVW